MSPRASASAAKKTRYGIVEAAVDQASMEGLESVTIGRLAGQLEMSKAGVIGPFGSKQQLQLATFQAAMDRFRRDVWEPVADFEPGLERLKALCDSWLT
jgi:AcrR family transcriptional regulator